MRILRNVLLAGATLGLVGAVTYAAPPRATHVITVPLPGGGVEQIRYTGDVPPQVVFQSIPTPAQAAALDGRFGADSPFATLDQIRAEMDREMAAMMQHRVATPPLASANGLQQATAGVMPPGAESYSVVSTVSGGHACTQSVEVTSQGPGKAPKVVRQTSGDCGAGHAAPAIPDGPKTAI